MQLCVRLPPSLFPPWWTTRAGVLGADFNSRLSSALFPLVSRRCERALIPIRCAFTLLLKRVYTAGCVDATAAVEF